MAAVQGIQDESMIPDLSPLIAIAEDLQLRCLSYLEGDFESLICIAATCNRFQQFLQDNDYLFRPIDCCDLGGFSYERDTEEPRLATWKEKQAKRFAVRWLIKEQRRRDNIFLHTFSTSGCPERRSGGFDGICERLLDAVTPDDYACFLRGDTLGALAEIIQAILIDIFQRAMEACLKEYEKYRPNEYPELSVAAVLELFRSSWCKGDLESMIGGQEGDGSYGILPTYFIQDFEGAEIVVMRLARRAGIPKLDAMASISSQNQMQMDRQRGPMDELWTLICHLMIHLCYRGYVEAKGQGISAAKPVLRPHQLPRNVTPALHFTTHDAGAKVVTHCTIVPRHIEEASRHLGFCHKVYGAPWVIRSKSYHQTSFEDQTDAHDNALRGYELVESDEEMSLEGKSGSFDSDEEISFSEKSDSSDSYDVQSPREASLFTDSDDETTSEDDLSIEYF